MSGDQQGSYGKTPTALGRCSCTHLEQLHAIAASGTRTGCSASSCPCPRYKEEP